jgi:hypothetical protein
MESIMGVICFFRLSGMTTSFLGDGLVEDDEAVPRYCKGVNAGALALTVVVFLAWVVLMVGAWAGVRGDEVVTVDGDVEARVEVTAGAGGVAGTAIDPGSEAFVGFSCLMEEEVVELDVEVGRTSSVSGLTSLTTDFFFLEMTVGTSKRDGFEALPSLDGAESVRLATVGATVGRVDGTDGARGTAAWGDAATAGFGLTT